MKPVRLIILGYGIRGRTYAAYALAHPDEYTLVGAADPSLDGPPQPGVRFWTGWEEALDADIAADAAVVSLPDRLHCAACSAALGKGLHVLLEKPLGCTWAECETIRAAQRKSGRLVLAGYVLRYSPFYKRLKNIVGSGCIGEIVSISHLAAVSYGKAAHSYCRGNWSVESEGTGMLVNKCTHDFDLISWWMESRACVKIASFGSLFHWRAVNRPDGAAARCQDCPAQVRSGCPFDAKKLYLDDDCLRYHFAARSDDAISRMIETSRYGRCVYACGNDSVDHQTVLMEYDGGPTVTLEMESFSKERGRTTRFFGSRGEILADGRTIEIRPFSGENRTIEPDGTMLHHGGGDCAIMSSFANFINTASPSLANSLFDSSLESHRLAFLAEESRKSGRVIQVQPPVLSP